MAVKVDTQKEIIFGSSDPNISRVLSKKEKNGELRKVAPRIYTTNLIDSLENIVRRNLMDILVYRYPDALISHRSAKEMRPTATGDFFLTNSTTRRVTDLPGITLNFVKGPKSDFTRYSVYGYAHIRRIPLYAGEICRCRESQATSRVFCNKCY